MVDPDTALAHASAPIKQNIKAIEPEIDEFLKTNYFGSPVRLPVTNNLKNALDFNKEETLKELRKLYSTWEIEEDIFSDQQDPNSTTRNLVFSQKKKREITAEDYYNK